MTRVVHILARRGKNNPVLVGEPGVGKTALAEGLAQRVADGKAPGFLRGASVYALDLGALLAGTRYRGDFEQRLKGVLAALDGQNAVLFIDELHTLVGAGATEGGSVDAANLLKPALARGKLRVMGATTPAELRHLEKDRALWRRFQTVEVPEPSEADALAILRGLAPKYADHHGVTYTGSRLDAAVRLSVRHLRDRFLPDKAIDVIDEAGAARSSAGTGGEIGVTDIEATVARMARVPVGAVKAEEIQSLATLEADLKGRVLWPGRCGERRGQRRQTGPRWPARRAETAGRPSCSPGRPGWARPSWPARWPIGWACIWPASTCPSIRRRTRWRA